MRNWLLFVHIVAGMAWLGSAIMFQMWGLRAARDPDPARSSDPARTLVYLAPRLVLPALLVNLFAGIGLVLESTAWDFQMGWIALAFVIVVASLVAFPSYYLPAARRVITLFDEQGPGPGLFGVWRRFVVASRINVLLLIVVLGVMIFKPGP